jgi:uncharacterized protein YgbK (DUF1537 family)
MTGSPEGLLLAFYGDDFTGSSAVMEVLTFAGIKTVMFMAPPGPEMRARFAGYRAIGIASTARAQSPAWMDEHLPEAFAALAALGAPVNHYKVCSTLDSSPTVGSIGRAIDIGAPIFARRRGAAPWQPLVIGAPALGRYQAFGSLFARHADAVYRLDRHPVMRDHPVTPMHEADVRRHIGAQTPRHIGLVDFAAIKRGDGDRQLEEAVARGEGIVAIDVLDDETLAWAGRAIWTRRGAGIFAVGSQGVEYALVAHWRAAGLLAELPAPPVPGPVDRMVAVSGSVSETTARQIDWAEANGFAVIALEAAEAVASAGWDGALARTLASARAALAEGRSPLVVTARGPADPAVARLRRAIGAAGADPAAVNARIGEGLGRLAGTLVRDFGLTRTAIAGGDTSGFAVAALGIEALEARAPLAPGAPLCRAFSADPAIDGLDIALKGGQMGPPEFFGSVRAGCAGQLMEKAT